MDLLEPPPLPDVGPPCSMDETLIPRVQAMKIKDLRAALDKQGVSTVGFIEKADFVQAYLQSNNNSNISDRVVWHCWHGRLTCHLTTSASTTVLTVAIANDKGHVHPDFAEHSPLFALEWPSIKFAPCWAGFSDEAGFSEIQRQSAARRSLHRVLRGHVNAFVAPFEFIFYATDWLSNSYIQTSSFKQSLDARIIAVDCVLIRGLLVPTQMTNVACEAIGYVGEDLESRGKFAQAAKIYLDVVHRTTDAMILCRFYNDGGLALKRAEQYDQSEECYIMALGYLAKVGTEQWQRDIRVEKTGLHVFCSNMCQLLESREMDRCEALLAQGKNHFWDKENRPRDMAEFVWYALLFAAGFRYSQAETKLRNALQDKGSQFLERIQPQFQSQSAALKMLVKAVTFFGSSFPSPSDAVQHFRSTLDACWHEGKSFVLPLEVVCARQEGSKQMARDLKADNAIFMCFGPDCGTFERLGAKNFMHCSACKQVSYCSKDCQVAHWKAGHKKECRDMVAAMKNIAGSAQKKNGETNKKQKGKK